MIHKGSILKDLIKKSAFTQRQVAKELGFHENYLGVLLKNADVKPDIIQKICTTIGIDYKDHFEQNPESTNYKSKYDQLQEKHISQTTELLDKVQGLITENHELKNQVIELKEENLKLRGR